MMSTLNIALLETTPPLGQLVHVRQRRYLVEEVTPLLGDGEAV